MVNQPDDSPRRRRLRGSSRCWLPNHHDRTRGARAATAGAAARRRARGIADGLRRTRGSPYRLSYVVGVDGRPGNPDAISPPDAPACLQEALRTWVATFRYAPVTEAERLTADWMLVSARRGS